MKKLSKWPLVSLIVLNWNGKEIIKDCLDSLLKTNYPNYRVVVVDNGSTDGSQDILRRFFRRKVELIINKENLGFSKGMNVGIRYVLKHHNPQYIGLLNNDLLFPDRKWLMKIIRVMENDKRIGVASPMFIFPNGKIQRIGEKLGKNLATIMIKILTALPERELKIKPKGVREVDVFLGAAPIIRKSVIDRIGILDERYSPFLVEDIEYSFRMKKFGYKSVTVCDAKVVHFLSYSTKKLTKKNTKKDLFKVYVATRNAMLFSLEYFGVLKTIFVSLPIIIFATFFKRKNKLERLMLRNIVPRKALLKRLRLLIKALQDCFILHRLKTRGKRLIWNSKK